VHDRERLAAQQRAGFDARVEREVEGWGQHVVTSVTFRRGDRCAKERDMLDPVTDPEVVEEAVVEEPEELVEEDLLVEDVSIDGMCGVY